MPEYVIFLDAVDPSRSRSLAVIRDHCRHLDRLDVEGCLIAAGPFSDAVDGGFVIGRFSTREEAEQFAAADPFVQAGHSRAKIRPWQWSHAENGHLGALQAAPGTHPRFLSTLALRATTREFSTRSIPLELVRSLLDAALAAPSEFNLQPWRPIVCHERADRQRLQSCCFGQAQVAAAALVVVCAVDPQVFDTEAPRAVDQFIARGHYSPDQRERAIAFIRSYYENPRDGAIRNGTIFGHQLLLAAVSQGLAGFWLGGFDEGAIRSEFGVPERVVVAGVVGLGWAQSPSAPMPREPVKRLVGWGGWHDGPNRRAATPEILRGLRDPRRGQS